MVRYDSAASTGSRRRRNSITRQEIVDAARLICERDGVAGLTVRSVADAMGASPMSLYNHVGTMDELLDALLDDVMGELRVADAPGETWQEELERFALALADHLDRHRWAVLPLMSRPDPGERTTAVGEIPLAAALRGGLSASVAVTAFAGILALVYGRAAFLAAAELPGAQRSTDIGAQISRAAADRHPATASVASELVGYASPVHLERSVRALIDGLTGAAAHA